MATAEQINNRKRVLKFIETYPQFHNQAGYFFRRLCRVL